jgi:chromosomal replication initiation ATPase DnaA
MRNKLNKIKIFTDESFANLEKKINSWFKQNKFIEIAQILQSETATNFESNSINGSLNHTITIFYKDTENPSLEMNETVAQEKVSKEEETSSTIPEPVEQKKASKETDGLEFLYEQLQDNSESGL